MEQQQYDLDAARDFILNKFKEQGDFLIFKPEELEQMVRRVQQYDEAYMAQANVENGEIYDDDAAYDYMFEQMTLAFPEQKMYMMRLVEDYMDYNEDYLESIGAIDWE